MAGLLEREVELATLAGALEAAAGGRGCVVLVGGEAGIGKTSLVRALRERAAFLLGACEPLSVPVPLGPLRELYEAAGGGDLMAHGDDRLTLARALLDALTACAPAVAVVEDAHWADPLTLDVLRLLARRVESHGVVLAVTYRDDEVAANPALGLLLGDLATSPAVRRIGLRPLSAAAVAELSEDVDPGELMRATGGNPFLVVETVAAEGQLPASVRDAALARAGRLSPAARAVADVAAVAGPRVEPQLLEALAPDSAAAVEEALARGVLVADGPLLGFRHELIREAIESSISPPRRRALHARVAGALPESDHARVAHHAELGGLTAEAARHAAAAAAEAERVGALRETHLQAQRALRLGADLTDDERFELLLQHSRAANFSSVRLEDAAASAEQAVALAGDPAREARALGVLAAALWSLDRLVEAKAAAERAVALLEPAGDRDALARALATDIRMEATAFDPAAALAAAPRALELAAGEARIGIEISVALARGHRGDRAAPALLAEARAAARRAGLTIQTIRAYVNSVAVGVTLRDHAFVDASTREALVLFEEYGTTIPAYAVELYRARSLLDRGRWDEARAVAARTDRDWVSETAIAHALDALVGVRRGEPGAHERLERAAGELPPEPQGSRHAQIRTALAEAAWLRGNAAPAPAAAAALGGDPAAAPTRAAARGDPAAPTHQGRFARWDGELALWAARLGVALPVPDGAPEPVVLELAGDWRAAIRAWRELDAPYEAALAALPGDDRAVREALATLHRLGATAAARAFARDRAARGARPARGPRPTTLANAAGLTRREQEVLEQVATGASNPAIAAALHLSERTVAHHVSAILAKLGAPNRIAAIERARTLGLLSQDGTAPPPS
ncbi:MAG TPA: AAA family ATPase [Solirubrobacteraceae bacterium]